jgi:hypothetical protein
MGANKLFWAKADDGHIDVAARPRSLIDAGHHLDQISAIPRGCVVDISPGNRRPRMPALRSGRSWMTTIELRV